MYKRSHPLRTRSAAQPPPRPPLPPSPRRFAVGSFCIFDDARPNKEAQGLKSLGIASNTARNRHFSSARTVLPSARRRCAFNRFSAQHPRASLHYRAAIEENFLSPPPFSPPSVARQAVQKRSALDCVGTLRVP